MVRHFLMGRSWRSVQLSEARATIHSVTNAPKYVLALEEARRGSEAQRASLGAVRGQAGTTLSTAGLCATFLGGIRAHDHVTTPIVVAVVAFVGVVLLTGWILLPIDKFRTTQDASVIVRWTDEHGASDDTQRQQLALAMTKQYGENAPRIAHRQRAYVAAMIFLAVELAALVIDLWRG